MHQKPNEHLIDQHCILCGKSESVVVMKKFEDGSETEPIILQKCLACKLVYLASWELRYSSEDYHYYADRIGKEKSELYCPITTSRYQDLLESFKKNCTGNKLLDFGCGQGHFVEVAVKSGWEASGIELSDPAVTICQNFNLPVKKLDLFSSDLKPRAYDIISMFEILEHLSQPAKALTRLEELLKPGGLLYLTTPNFASLDRKLLGPQGEIIYRGHLSYFTPDTLKHLINRHSTFETIYLKTRNMSVSALRNLFSPKKENPQKKEASATTGPEKNISERDPLFRQKVESSNFLKFGKHITNQGLNWLGWGATIVALLRKKAD